MTASSESFDRMVLETEARIARFGYTMIIVGYGMCSYPGCDCGPAPYPYAYSLGLFHLEHPEIVMFGVPTGSIDLLAKTVYHGAASGKPLAVGREHRHRINDERSFALVPVPDRWVARDPGRIGSWFRQFGGRQPPPFLQVCWSDTRGRMPWHPDADPNLLATQPLLADDPIRYPRPITRQVRRHRRR